MTNSYWKKLNDLVRKYSHSHAMSYHLKEFGKELGRNNQPIPKDRVVQLLVYCKINDLDYLFSSLLDGHHEGLKEWRVQVLNAERKARLEKEKQLSKARQLAKEQQITR